MKKLLALAALVAAFSFSVQAQEPRKLARITHFAKAHQKFLIMEGVAIAGASIHAAGLHHCRKTNGVEPCDEHYGSAWAMYGVSTAMSVVIFPAISHKCDNDGPDKVCTAVGFVGPAFQIPWGIHEWTIHHVEQEAPHPKSMANREFQ